MACYHPLKAFMQPNPIDLEKNQVFVRSSKVQALRFTDHGIKSILDPKEVSFGDLQTFEYVPCRKCFGCREDSAKMWTDRLMMELQFHESNWFVTLTYDDDHLPMSSEPNKYGIVPDFPTLQKKDLQDFFKRLRSYYDSKEFKKLHGDQKIMYYAAGEYGDSSKRPHYHAIIFGLYLDDLQEWKTRSGFIYYSSKILEDIWQHGFVSVAKVNRSTAAYTCRYVMKKAMGDQKELYYERGIEPEFQIMSRRPAIARNYYETFVEGKQEEFYVNKIHYLTGPDAEPISFNIPRYFDVLTEKENSDIILSVKKNRKRVGQAVQKLKEAQSSNDYLSILSSEEDNKIARNINFRNSCKGGIKL